MLSISRVLGVECLLVTNCMPEPVSRLTRRLLARTRRVAVGLTLGLIVGWNGQSWLSSASAQQPPTPEVLFAAVRDSLEELPADRYELTAVLDQVRAAAPANEVSALFEWVRDLTGLSAYRGVLKGPAGVLMDRSGNSLDRAFLLQNLLAAAGEQAILATGQLDQVTADAVVNVLRAPPADDSSTAADTTVYAERLAATLGADAAVAAQRLRQAETARADLRSELSTRTDEQAAALLEVLGGALSASDASGRAALVTDHWWVQVMRDGAWLDLDPTMPDAQPGQVLTAATARFGPTSLAQIAAVEGSCRDLACGERIHSVVIRAISERWDGSELSETLLVERELLPADLIGTSVTFVASPRDWPDGLDLFNTTRPLDELSDALAATEAWEARLVIGDDTLGDMTVNDDGSTSQRGGGGGVGGFGGAIGGGFGGGFGGGGGSSGEFTALWLEFEIRTPGRGVSTQRRAIFDLVGPTARTAGVQQFDGDDATRMLRATALAGETHVGLQPARLQPSVLSAVAAGRLLAAEEEWTALYYQGASADPDFIVERQNDMANLTTRLESFGLLRSQTADALAAAGHPTADTSLAVALYHRAMGPDLQPYSSYDLVTSPARGEPDAALRQGVADSNLEALLQSRLDPVSEGGAPAVVAVADAFAADIAAGRPWLLVHDATQLDNAAPDLSADLRQRVLDDLAAGYLAVVPQGGAGAVGWWRVDHATGTVIGMGDRGWGQAMAQYDVTTNVILQLRTALNQYASMAQCLGIALTMPLRGETGVSEELAECVFKLVCGSINTAINTLMVTETNWTNVILSATIDALWGGTPETGFGGFCGGLWNRLAGG